MVRVNPKLRLAAEWHANDVLNNRALDGDIGSDGSTVADRARAAGYVGEVAETVAINPALAINGIDIMNQWFSRPDYKPPCPVAPTPISGCGRSTARPQRPWSPSTAAATTARRYPAGGSSAIVSPLNRCASTDIGVGSTSRRGSGLLRCVLAGLDPSASPFRPSRMPTTGERRRRPPTSTPSSTGPAATPSEGPPNNGIKINPKLRLAAQWHTDDVLNKPRAGRRHRLGRVHGHRPRPRRRDTTVVAETVAINPALAINGVDPPAWMGRPDYMAIMAGLQQRRHRGVVGEPGARSQRRRRGLRQG